MSHWAEAYVGLPFVCHGRNRAGFDCYGLVRDIYWNQKKVWLPLLVDHYKDSANPTDTMPLILEERDLNWTPIAVPEEFAVVVINIKGLPTHIGVMLDSKRFIHVLKGRETAIEMIDSPLWNKRIEGFYQCNL